MSRGRQRTPAGRAARLARPAGGARLSGPQPVDPARLAPVAATATGPTPPAPGAPTPPPPAATAPAGALENATFEQLQAMLAARGVTWQRLEAEGEAGRWKF